MTDLLKINNLQIDFEIPRGVVHAVMDFSFSVRPGTIVALAGNNPMIAWAVTDFPEPDSPTKATIVPGRTEKEKSTTA